jgi:hypothetical protein
MSDFFDDMRFPIKSIPTVIRRTIKTEVLFSRNRREKENRIGVSRSENEPYLFRIKFVPEGNRIRDVALTSYTRNTRGTTFVTRQQALYLPNYTLH